jgi:hypothetical protein
VLGERRRVLREMRKRVAGKEGLWAVELMEALWERRDRAMRDFGWVGLGEEMVGVRWWWKSVYGKEGALRW